MEEKQRMIQEYVPGKQVTIAHIIASPTKEIYEKIGLLDISSDAIGILTLTPSEVSIIAVDIATKAADVKIGFIDRFSGAVVITGDIASVESALKEVVNALENTLGFQPIPITRT